ncbi:pentapeptide repeat-containing protein [Fluviicola sp.]|uniref:pentapeptide repeat-containing protein n=1 Tax=Fluviicola sp. TaxID=1917219 RepID=UPI0031DBCCA1
METKIIGNKIAEARKKNTISQAQLAERLFISPQAVGKWERGESLPDIITFNRLAKILGVDLNYFSEDFPSVGTGTAVSPVESSELDFPSGKNKLHWDMSRGNWVDADFSGLKDLHEKFSSSNMKNCRFIGSDLSGLLLKSNNIDRCDFSDSDLSGSQIRNSNLANNQFKNCSLRDAEFSGSHVSGCDFTGADFTGALIKSGGLEKGSMSQVILKRTAFHAAYLADLVFDSTLEDCSFENCSFARVTFQNATLVNTFFKCRSLKRIKFIDCQADRMTYEFLKNGRADLSGITLIA